MSQTDTYRPAVLPSEAVMIPAAEAPEEAQERENRQETAQNARKGMSASLERMRMQSRMMYSQPLQWISPQSSPLDAGAALSQPRPGRNLTPSATPLTRRNTVSQGAALSTLMRSAARRYSPPPLMRMPTPFIDGAGGMRGALRSVVSQTQMPHQPYGK